MQLPRSAFRVAASARPGVVERDLRRAVVVLLLAASFGIRLAFGGTGPVELVPILLGAAWFGLRAARLTTTVAVCLLIVAAGLGGVPVGTAVVTALLVVASGELVARLFERLDTQASELRGLRPLQEALAPTAPPELPLLEVGVRHLPATPGVAGDFYLVAEGHNNSTVIAVGDVMGKGMKAAERATFIRATLAALAATTDDPAYLLQGANAQLVRQYGASADFVTMVCMVIRADATLSFASAGHPAPVSLADGSPLGNPPPCFPLGIAPELSGVKPVAAKLPDAGVVLYTDGLTDAKPHNFEPFGRKRIGLVLKDLADPSPQVAVDHLAAAARVFARRALSDDVCLVAVRSKLARPRVRTLTGGRG